MTEAFMLGCFLSLLGFLCVLAFFGFLLDLPRRMQPLRRYPAQRHHDGYPVEVGYTVHDNADVHDIEDVAVLDASTCKSIGRATYRQLPSTAGSRYGDIPARKVIER